jgi:hypothetical protein
VPNSRVFQEGDFVNFDATCFYDGYFGDSSVMIEFGETDPLAKELVSYTTRLLRVSNWSYSARLLRNQCMKLSRSANLETHFLLFRRRSSKIFV